MNVKPPRPAESTSGLPPKLGIAFKQKLVGGALWVVGAKFVGLICGLATNAMLARLMPTTEMGVYFIIFSVVNFSILFSMCGMERTVVRFVSSMQAKNKKAGARKVIVNCLELGLGFAIVLALIIQFGGGQFVATSVFKSRLMADLTPYLACWVILFTMTRITAEAFRGFSDIRLATIFNGTITGVTITVLLSFFYFQSNAFEIQTALILILYAHGINLGIAAIFLIKKLRSLRSTRGSVPTHKTILNSSWPLGMSEIFISGLQYGHLWLIGYYCTKESVAIYGAVTRVLILILAALAIVRMVIPPLVGQLYAQKRYQETERLMRLTATVAGLPAILALIILIISGKALLDLLFGEPYASGYLPLLILSSAHLVNVFTGTPGVLLVMAAKEKVMLLISLVSGTAGIFTSLFLIESLDFVGVSIGAALGIILQNVFMALYCLNKLSINTFFNWAEIIQLKQRFSRTFRPAVK